MLYTFHSAPSIDKLEKRQPFFAFKCFGDQHEQLETAYQRWRRLSVVALAVVAVTHTLAIITIQRRWRPEHVGSLDRTVTAFDTNDEYTATLVVASMAGSNTSWLADVRPQWNKKIYVTDDSTSTLTVPENKGREAMVYLTYIIDHYHKLTDITIFQHAARYQWHNDDPLYDGKRMLDRLQLHNVLEQGYVNLRCVWTLGCPSEIYPLDQQLLAHSRGDSTGSHYAQAFTELFPMQPIPERVGVSCCAQFAVSQQTILERPLTDYIRYRNWLLETELSDDVSGRVLEYSWHIIFGKKAVFCPDAKACYCEVYGLCELSCETIGTCSSQYTLARYSKLPEDWPEGGWDGETRNVTQLREEQARDYAPV